MTIFTFTAPPQFFTDNISSPRCAARVFNPTHLQPSCSRTAFQDHSITETETAFLLNVDLPGVKAADISLTFDEGILKITGTRKFRGQHSSSFVKSFAIDSVSMDTTNVTANLADGVLVVSVAKKVKSIAESIPITENSHEDWVAVETSKTGTEEHEVEKFLFEPAIKTSENS